MTDFFVVLSNATTCWTGIDVSKAPESGDRTGILCSICSCILIVLMYAVCAVVLNRQSFVKD